MKVLVTGGAGYVGTSLVEALLYAGHDLTVLDWYLFGENRQTNCSLEAHKVKADIRDPVWSAYAVDGQDVVIHLACISNDPSFELNPELGRSVNYDATVRLVQLAKDAGVKRFIFASSSSVYGVKPDGVEVTEDLALLPLTDYSRYKAMGEDVVLKAQSPDFCATVLRPATLCGYAPRQRLDLIVNILTTQAVCRRVVPVLGGSQRRPNLHVADMVRAYLAVLEAPTEQIAGQVFNVGCENATVLELAQRVQAMVGGELAVTPTTDLRSYAINSERIARVLGFRPEHTIDQAIADLAVALTDGRVPNALDDPRYYNIRQMQTCHIS